MGDSRTTGALEGRSGMSGRDITRASDLDALDFSKGGGLVPVVAQDAGDGTVLMVGFADREALEATLNTGKLHFHSRTRGGLWMKGETSGNVLAVRSLTADCDADAVLVRVEAAGPTCHTGARSCFQAAGSPTGGGSEEEAPVGMEAALQVLARLAHTLERRWAERPEGSYTVRLLEDANLRLKKLGEESAEVVAALAGGDPDRAREEGADLLYHLLVALRAAGITLPELASALSRRM